jgi:hypothetical protein
MAAYEGPLPVGLDGTRKEGWSPKGVVVRIALIFFTWEPEAKGLASRARASALEVASE